MSSRYYTKRLVAKRPARGPKAPYKPRAFKTETTAKAWADKYGMKEYLVEQIADKKFKIRNKF